MRKIVIVAGALMGAALLAGTPAKAELGCTCVKLGAPAACVSGFAECTFKNGGLCVLPCAYKAPKMSKRHMGKKKKKCKRGGCFGDGAPPRGGAFCFLAGRRSARKG
jgi:hypothetical protein